MFFFEKRISITFLTPSYVRMLGNQTGPFLKMLFVGSEPANNVYNKSVDLINIYAASESGFAVGVFQIDKPYDTCPIGKPEIDCKITLFDEEGNVAEDGEIGELCFENPFVRGYINLPEETEKAFQDGIYHTGDLARMDANGNYVLLGRSGDMIKINGNRIEPAEIEASVKQVLGIDWAAARGFEENGKSYLCAYYTADIEVDADKMREELSKRLPYYMIPAYYIKIDKVPLKPNGKMDRKALPQPDASDFKPTMWLPRMKPSKSSATRWRRCSSSSSSESTTISMSSAAISRLHQGLFDMEKMADAMRTAIRNHSALLTTFHFNEDGDIIQRYTPEVLREIHVEKVNEFEFSTIKDTLVQPFKIIGGCLHRCRVFETEKYGYVFFDVHHTLFDGTSLKVFMQNVGKAYMGMQPDPDLYYLILQNREDEQKTGFYEESRKYFEEKYSGVEWSSYPETDHESRENEMGELFAPIGIEQPQMKAMERQYKISRNEFFITVAALAIAAYNDASDIKLSWIYNGREDVNAMNSVGLLFRELPIGVRLTKDMTLRELFADVHEQVQKGIEHACYPYVDITAQAGGGETAYLLYQQDIRDMGGLDGMDVETIDIRQNQAASQTILDMEILDGADGLQLMIDYTASLYDDESMDKFKDIFIRIAQGLVTHNPSTDITMNDLRNKYANKKGFFETVIGIFRRKK